MHRTPRLFAIRPAFLFLVLSCCTTAARADSTLNIAGVRTDLHSAKTADVMAALKLLKGEDAVPDELIGDVLAAYAQANAEDVPSDTAKPAQDLPRMFNRLAMQMLYDGLWEKMNPAALATNLRPYLDDPKRQGLVREIPSHDKKVAALLVPELRQMLRTSTDESTISMCASALQSVGPAAKPEVPELIAHLSDPVEDTRLNVADALAAIGVDDAKDIPTLVKGVGDSNLVVAGHCEDLLAKLPFDPATQVPQLLDDLNTGESYNMTIADWLHKAGPQVIQQTIDHAAKAPADAFENHLLVLSRFGAQATKVLAADLHSSNDNLRRLAIEMAVRFPDADQKGVDWLTPYLNDPSTPIRIYVLEEWMARQKDASKRLDLLTKDIADPQLRDTAIELTIEEGPLAKSLLPAIRERAQLAGDEERIECLQAEWNIDPSDEQAYQDLIAYLKSPDYLILSKTLSTLIYDDMLRKKSKELVQRFYDDPKTSKDMKFEIEMDWKGLKERDASARK